MAKMKTAAVAAAGSGLDIDAAKLDGPEIKSNPTTNQVAYCLYDGNSPRPLASLPRGTPPELVAAIEGAARRAFQEHGSAAFAASREAAIFHEVGHTIVGTHEGVIWKSVRIFSREAPLVGTVWGGWCAADERWTTDTDTSADDDLRRARIIIAGLAGEALTGMDKPGSSLDELALSQLIGINAGVKLGDPTLADAAHSAFVQKLWHEQVWRVTISILRANHGPFFQLAEHLNQYERIKGGKLRKLLAKVQRIAP
jgi:hypothetical protein